MEAAKNTNVQLLATLVDSDDKDESEYRFLIDGTHVKYVTVAPGILPKDDRTFAPAVLAGLPPLPLGNWNMGHVGYDSASGEPVFLRTAEADLPGIKTIWHATCIDHLELRKLERLRQNIHIVSHPLFDRPVVAKFTEFPWQTPYLEAETAAYQWIEGSHIGPRFLGHLTEEGRVIGFVLEYIGNARAAGPGDLAACQSVLKKLHSLGIRHGDINKHNFLVQRDGRVALLDFETAKKDASLDELEAEYQQLTKSLQDPSLRGAIRLAAGLSEQMPP
ncbi:hypothetical protein CONLIGDRAFT_432151 [Coniochaeta ligniaria NRRL 30616]|uniref:Alpha-galactosidase A n=1 Tax=Coniochaeta ligniaria NRRL 30616 TaxID=1408157 RepID=A0A1J7JCM1_9PEZI|nr:hypothetical protein CONLIGDRAFT_432151 [Coniochaeta ligniaria NRRL 30616]